MGESMFCDTFDRWMNVVLEAIAGFQFHATQTRSKNNQNREEPITRSVQLSY